MKSVIDEFGQTVLIDEFGVQFVEDGKRLLKCPQDFDGKYEVPEGVEALCGSSFENCMHLRGIKLPQSLKRIGDSAFKGCNNLREIDIPDTVSQLLCDAFYSCSFLRKVVLPSSTTYLPGLLFGNCSGLQEVVIPDSVQEIESTAFDNCKNLQRIVVSDAERARITRLLPEELRPLVNKPIVDTSYDWFSRRIDRMKVRDYIKAHCEWGLDRYTLRAVMLGNLNNLYVDSLRVKGISKYVTDDKADEFIALLKDELDIAEVFSTQSEVDARVAELRASHPDWTDNLVYQIIDDDYHDTPETYTVIAEVKTWLEVEDAIYEHFNIDSYDEKDRSEIHAILKKGLNINHELTILRGLYSIDVRLVAQGTH